jgi:broad specificity phosphatase PhoE
MDVWLVRHGQTAWNQARRFQGERDVELSEEGRGQAEQLGLALAGERFDAVYTSPLRRARDTAVPCAARLDLVPVPLDGVREIGLGEWEGLTVESVVERYGEHYWRWLTAPAGNTPPGGEPMGALRRRVGEAMDGLAARHPDGRVLVVSHGGVIAAFVCQCLGLGLDAIWRIRVTNTSVTRVELPAGRLLSLNDTRHLAAAPVPAGAP